MPGRLPVILVCLCLYPLTAQAGSPVPDSGEIRFEIKRDGESFGRHILRFSENEKGQRIVHIDIEMSYCMGPICLFSYSHTNREVRDNGEIVSFASKTNDDGDRYKVRAKWRDDKVIMTVNGDKRTAPADAAPTTYWREDMFKSDKLINTQKGTVQEISFKGKEQDTYDVVGESRKARHYSIKTDRRVEVWYDAATAQWIGLKFPARGSTITYHRTTPIEKGTP